MEVALLSFLIGSIPTGYLVARLHGVDIREQGSGNIGATNVARTLGKKAGVATLITDLLKGAFGAALPVLMLRPDQSPGTLALCGVAAIIGHCFSPFLHFKGGKGVATGIGAFLYLAPIASLCALIIFYATVRLSRYVSLASIIAAIAVPILLAMNVGGTFDAKTIACATVAVALIVYRHVPNIRRLMNGTESRRGAPAAART